MRVWNPILACFLILGTALAVEELIALRLEKPVRTVTGVIADYAGDPIVDVDVDLYDNPQVWDDEHLSLQQKRSKQKKIARTVSDGNGGFRFKSIPDGQYEIVFHKEGWNLLSVRASVARSAHGKLCVELQVSGGPGTPKAENCH